MLVLQEASSLLKFPSISIKTAAEMVESWFFFFFPLYLSYLGEVGYQVTVTRTICSTNEGNNLHHWVW